MIMRRAAPRELNDFFPGKITISAYMPIAIKRTIHFIAIKNS
jgi:hypothetical protein